MNHHNESDRLRTPSDESAPYTPQISAETREWLLRRFPWGLKISEKVANLVDNPENSIVRDEKRYPRWFEDK